jgi:hypothetical protein
MSISAMQCSESGSEPHDIWPKLPLLQNESDPQLSKPVFVPAECLNLSEFINYFDFDNKDRNLRKETMESKIETSSNNSDLHLYLEL